MNPPPEAFSYHRTPKQRSITIASGASLTLAQVIQFMDTAQEVSAHSDLVQAREDLKRQEQDSELSKTNIGGRNASISQFVLSQDELMQLGRLDEDQWLRFIQYRYKFKVYPKKHLVNDFPIVLCVEPTSVCNLKCQMCFQSDPTFSKEKAFLGKMNIQLYRQIIDEMEANHCESLVLASRGEPTLHPQFSEMVRYAAPKILDIKINTNATRLTEKLSHEILKADINLMVFSIDSADPKQYEEIRKGARFDEVLANIKQFQAIREKDYPNSRTITRVSGTLFREDQDAKGIQAFWSDQVDQVALHTAWPFWDSYSAPVSKVTHPCGVLWERMYVWWDGVCNPCDIDYKSCLQLGQLSPKTSLKEIWLSQETQRYRQLHQDGKKNDCTPCNRCSGTP